MSELTRDEVAKVALLSRLECDAQSLDRYTREIGNILQYVEQLREVDVEGVPPTAHAIPLRNVWREDEPRPPLHPSETLANAPQQAEGCFKVPAVLKGAGSS
jgi:aspartyl-tRNA(Asn)/glutamyl-tRNA(Gln) amidotransferase subunit C